MKENNVIFDEILMIDKTIHEPARLFLMSILYNTEEVDFLFLLNETQLSKGNIATHTRKLEDEGYLTIKKEFVGKKTHSTYMITENGKKIFEAYTNTMKKILDEITQ